MAIHARSQRQSTLVVLVPPELAEMIRGLGSSKSKLVDQLALMIEDGKITVNELPEDPIKCLKGSRPKTIQLRASREAYNTLKRYADAHGLSLSSLLRRLLAWYLGYTCEG